MSLRRVLAVASLPLVLAACGGGGNVAIDLTDAPPDVAALDKVEVTLSSVSVHVAQDDAADDGTADQGSGKDTVEDDGADSGWVTVTDRGGTFDLLALQNDVTAPIGEVEIPAGKITQIRLHIDEAGRNVVTLKDGTECPMDLSKVNKNGIKINHPFKALEPSQDGTLHVVVDFDLKESVDQAGDCSFKLNPVIKIKKTEVK